MKLTKKLSRLSASAYGLVFNPDVLAQLGVKAVNAPGEVEVTLTFYGDTLVVRRADAEPPTPAEVAYFLTDDLGLAKHFPTRQVAEVDEVQLAIETFIKPGARLRLTPMMRYGFGLFKAFGELSRDDLIKRFGVAPAQATRILSAGFEDHALLKRGNRYRLNPEVFDV